jgi:hypothetical protein
MQTFNDATSLFWTRLFRQQGLAPVSWYQPQNVSQGLRIFGVFVEIV